MTGTAFVELLNELTRSLTDEQRKAINHALQQGVALIKRLLDEERERQKNSLSSKSSAMSPDIPDMRGRWP